MLNFLTQVAVTLAAWLVIMFVCTNLIGFFVRGSFTNPDATNAAARGNSPTNDCQKAGRGRELINFVLPLITLIFLIALYYFWNIGLVIAALMLIVARIPDLIWEIEQGRGLQMRDMTRPKFYLASTVLSWGSLPVVWYSLYRL